MSAATFKATTRADGAVFLEFRWQDDDSSPGYWAATFYDDAWWDFVRVVMAARPLREMHDASSAGSG